MAQGIAGSVALILRSLRVTIPSLLIGVTATFIFMNEAFVKKKEAVLATRNAEISNLQSVVQSERARSAVQEERLRALGDRITYLQEKLEYKPQDLAIELQELRNRNSTLEEEVLGLVALREILQQERPEQIDVAELQLKLEALIQERDHLRGELMELRDPAVIRQHVLREGNSWVGFGGKAVVGLNNVDLLVNGSFQADITLSFQTTTRKKVMAGDRFQFQIHKSTYSLIIETVQYVGGTISISVFGPAVG